MVDNAAAVGAVVLMMLVTFGTRVGGVWLMSRVRITPRIEAFLRYMAASVLISIVAPATLAASPRIWIAVGGAVITMLVTRRAMPAMMVGAVLAAVAYNFLSL